MIQNPQFTVIASADTPGFAANWSATFVGQAEARYDFHGDVPQLSQGWEAFEVGWAASAQLFRTTLGAVAAMRGELFDNWLLSPAPGDNTAHPFELGFALSVLESKPWLGEGTETFSKWVVAFRTALTTLEAYSFKFDQAYDAMLWFVPMFDFSLEGVALDAMDFDTSSGRKTAHASDEFLYVEQQIMQLHSPNSFVRVDGQSFVGAINDLVQLIAQPNSRLPSPFREGLSYYIAAIDSGAVYLKSSRDGSAQIEVTNDGGGTFAMTGDPGSVWISPMR